MEDNEILPLEEARRQKRARQQNKRGWRVVRGDKDCIRYTWQDFLDYYRCPRIANAIWRESLILPMEDNGIPTPEELLQNTQGRRFVRSDKDGIPYTWQEFLDYYRCPRIAYAIWKEALIHYRGCNLWATTTADSEK